jgi:hypothetical protein
MNSNDFEIVVIYCRYYALIFDNAWVYIKEASTLQAGGLIWGVIAVKICVQIIC